MVNRLAEFRRACDDDVRLLYALVLVKTGAVVLLLLVLWALREKDAVVAYMRF